MSVPRAGTAGDPGETLPDDAGNRRAVLTVVFVVFLDLVGFGIVIPILPFYVRTFTPDETFIGLLAASYSLMQFLFAPFLGRLSDRRGRRPVLLLSLAGAAVAWTIFGIGGALWVLFASRMLAGAMGGNIAAAQAYVADVTPPERRAGALGLVGAAFGLGFVFGPGLGALFASDPVVSAADALLPAAVPTTRFSLPAFAAAGFSVLAILVGLLFLTEPERDRSVGDGSSPTPESSPGSGATGRSGDGSPAVSTGRSWIRVFRRAVAGRLGGSAASDDPAEVARSRRLRALVVAFFVVSVAFSGVQVMFIPFVADVYGYDATGAGLLLTFVGVLGVINQGALVGRLARRFEEAHLATAGAVLLLSSLAALPFSRQIGRAVLPAGSAFLAPELLALLAVLAALSLGNSLLNVSLSTLVSSAASAATQGSAFGVTQGAGSLGRTVGPPAMAALYAAAGFRSPFLVGSLLLVAVVAIVARIAAGRTLETRAGPG